MYICVCKAVTDTQLRTAIDNGVCTRRELTHCFGVGKDCGKCNKEVKELLKECKSSPRPWGCFQTAIYPMALPTVFPTPVGVFPNRHVSDGTVHYLTDENKS